MGMSIKGISSTSIWNGILIKGISSTLIWNGMMIKGIFSTLIIWNWNDDQRDLLYFDNLELKWWSMGSPLVRSSSEMMVKGISFTSIWNGNVDQRDLLYFDLEWNDDQRDPEWNDDQRDLLYFDMKWNDGQRDLLYFDNLELKWLSKGSPLLRSGMKWWSKGSPLLW